MIEEIRRQRRMQTNSQRPHAKRALGETRKAFRQEGLPLPTQEKPTYEDIFRNIHRQGKITPAEI